MHEWKVSNVRLESRHELVINKKMLRVNCSSFLIFPMVWMLSWVNKIPIKYPNRIKDKSSKNESKVNEGVNVELSTLPCKRTFAWTCTWQPLNIFLIRNYRKNNRHNRNLLNVKFEHRIAAINLKPKTKKINISVVKRLNIINLAKVNAERLKIIVKFRW